mgnify:CR=1 FL=1
MQHDTKIVIKPFEWDQVETGTLFRKFTATDEGGDNKDYRVTIHGVIDESGNVFVLQENVTSDAVICGRKEESQ